MRQKNKRERKRESEKEKNPKGEQTYGDNEKVDDDDIILCASQIRKFILCNELSIYINIVS